MTILGIDYGTQRMGLAIAEMDVKIARPLTTIDNDDKTLAQLQDIIKQHGITQIVAGLPRNLDSNDTPQTALAREFAAMLEKETHLPVTLQDEALTSQVAEERLRSIYPDKIDPRRIDQEAATIILQDYLDNL